MTRHHTHLWSLDGEHHVFSAHVVVAVTLNNAKIDSIKERVRQLVTDFGIGHTTLEMEQPANSCKPGAATSYSDGPQLPVGNGKKG